MHHSIRPLRPPPAFVGALPLGLVAAADWIFYGHVLGWTLGLFLLLALGVVLLARAPAGDRRTSRWPVVATAGFALALVVQTGPLALMMGIGALLVTQLSLESGWTTDTHRWLRRSRGLLVRVCTQLPRDLFSAGRGAPELLENGARPARTMVSHWALPVLGASLFVWLFNAANPVIEGWVTELARLLSEALEAVLGWIPGIEAARLVFWLCLAALFWPLAHGGPRSEETAPIEASSEVDTPPAAFVLRSLALFNAVFLAQTLLDLTYLFGGAPLPEGMSYAEYAHRGAYPLVATTLLAALFVLACFRPGGPAERDARCRALALAWIAQNVLLIVSTVWRLALYVDAYSLTRLRLATFVWLALVTFGFVTLCLRLLAGRSNRWLLGANVTAVLTVLLVSCFVDFDTRIAWYNVQHCTEVRGHGPALDVHYLVELGPESLPPLHWYEERRSYTDEALAHAVNQLARDLVESLDDWRGWTWVRHRVRAQLPPDWLDSKLQWRGEG